MEKNKKIIGIIGAVVLILILGNQMGLFATSGASLSRTGPSTVSPGQSFTINYITAGTPSGNWFVAWEDSISGGCTPSIYQAFLANGGSGSKTFSAPNSGTCTFTGFYQFTDGSKVNFPSKTVTVSGNGGDDCVPNCVGKSCGSDGCGGNCGICSTGDTCTNYVCVPSGTGNGGGDTNGEVPSFDINQELFKLGDFGVTILHLLIIFAGFYALSFFRK